VKKWAPVFHEEACDHKKHAVKKWAPVFHEEACDHKKLCCEKVGTGFSLEHVSQMCERFLQKKTCDNIR
jgi:hypothetical protein